MYEETAVLNESLSMGFLVLLESLTPAERAAFLSRVVPSLAALDEKRRS